MPLDLQNIYFDSRLAYSCASLWFYVFGVFILSVEATSTWFFLVLILCPLLTYITIQKYAIPPPDPELVEEVLGLEVEADSEIANGSLCLRDSNGEEEPYKEGVVMKVIAQRFAGLDAPENTLEALELCYKNGAIGAEFDLVLTKDLVPVVFHDAELDRVSHSAGNIQDKTWDELQKLDVSTKHPFHERFIGSKIPLFEDVILKAIEYDMRIFIDIKDDRPEMTKIILDTFKKYPVLYRRAVVSSFNFFIVYAIRRSDPSIVCSMAWRPHYMTFSRYSPVPSDCLPYSSTSSALLYPYHRLLDHLTTWFFNNLASQLVGFSAALLNKDVITPVEINFWKCRNVRVIAWTVNKPLEKLHMNRNLGIAYMTDSMLGVD